MTVSGMRFVRNVIRRAVMEGFLKQVAQTCAFQVSASNRGRITADYLRLRSYDQDG